MKLDKIVKLNVQTLAVLLTPTFLRGRRMVAWLRVLTAPLASLHYAFTEKRTQDLYKLAHNGQVCYLEKALNDRFDRQSRRIRIEDGTRYKQEYIYTQAENRPRIVSPENPMILYPRGYYADIGVDFIVKVPREIYKTNDYEMKALIDFYRLASKRYKIEPYE
jgi:hypothetical protein|nr:MAG TPA: hypothetical protein [Caudoviricetes sp.]